MQVRIKKSTGHTSLDAAAVSALKQWRFRPGSWKTLNIPVHFLMHKTHQEYREAVRRDQQQKRQL
jgi:outer membrane biosynthesis protein TonB